MILEMGEIGPVEAEIQLNQKFEGENERHYPKRRKRFF
jgi:hypothetical protein